MIQKVQLGLIQSNAQNDGSKGSALPPRSVQYCYYCSIARFTHGAAAD